MLNVSEGFREAVSAVSRQIKARAVLEVIAPDLTWADATGSAGASWSRPAQLHNKEFDSGPRYATLETGRLLLDGETPILPTDPQAAAGEVGYASDAVCDGEGLFASPVVLTANFTNVSILQACSVYFPTETVDGIPVDFTVDVLMDTQVIYSRSFADNREASVKLTDFTVYDPTAIRVTITRWSLPYRRARVLEIIPGLYERWTLGDMVSLDVQMRGNFAGLALPYGTASIRVNNADRRFEPYTRTGVFKSIEERQSLALSLGAVQPDGTVEYAPIGVYYQKSGGWDTGQNDMYMDWELVDICGLLADRTFLPPDILPTTLGGWFQCFVSQLGDNFTELWHVDPDYKDLPVYVNDREDVQGRDVGALIRFACMATGTWPRADQETGALTAEPLWSQGSKVTLDQLSSYPKKSANDALATLTFKLYDGAEEDTLFVVSGNSTSSNKNLDIDNPFIHSEAAALTAARQILSQYGGIKLEADSRGNPATEIGDVDTIWINSSEAKTGRRMEQAFKIADGVLKQNHNLWLQADGSFLFEAREVLTGSGTWTVPDGVHEIRYIMGQGAQGSTAGADGEVIRYDSTFDATPSYTADDGTPGQPGRILSGVLSVNPGAVYAYSCGAGTAAGAYGATVPEGGDTTFGPNLTTANGTIFENGFTDIAIGSAYGRANVALPLDGTSDGPAAGAGGTNELWKFSHSETIYNSEGKPAGTRAIYTKVSERSDGSPGAKGADGFIVLYWDKED